VAILCRWIAFRGFAIVGENMLPPRVLACMVPLLLASGPSATMDAALGALDPTPVELPTLSEPTPPPKPVAVVPAEAEPRIDLDAVHWTAPVDESVERLAMRWGLTTRRLVRLNPSLDPDGMVAAGTRLVVYRPDPDEPTQSIGAPNRGRLRGGIPLPEGRYWQLRDHRKRAYGTRDTITALLQAFNAYGEAFPDAPPIRLGEISQRNGGRVFPHVSHRTGRDVDIGYILTRAPSEGRYWVTARPETFDVEKNWFLIKALVSTGKVQRIFISASLQKLLRERAAEELTPEEMARYFRMPGRDRDEPPLIRDWNGHRDHMHVRFRCEEGNKCCRSRSVDPA